MSMVGGPGEAGLLSRYRVITGGPAPVWPWPAGAINPAASPAPSASPCVSSITCCIPGRCLKARPLRMLPTP